MIICMYIYIYTHSILYDLTSHPAHFFLVQPTCMVPAKNPAEPLRHAFCSAKASTVPLRSRGPVKPIVFMGFNRKTIGKP